MSNQIVSRYAAHLASVSQAAIERARSVVSGHIPFASHDVVDVLAERWSVGAVLASAEAEFGGGNEVLCDEISISTI